MQPAGHGELPGPLGGGRPQQRRLDLDEALPVHGRPQGAVDRGPQAQVGLHAGPAQVHEPVPQPDDLVDVDPVVHGNGGGSAALSSVTVQSPSSTSPGGQLRVDGPLRAGPDRALDGHDVLGADVDGARHHALDDAGVVAQVEEGQVLAVLAALGHPAAHGHRGARRRRPAAVPQRSGAHRRWPRSTSAGLGGNGHCSGPFGRPRSDGAGGRCWSRSRGVRRSASATAWPPAAAATTSRGRARSAGRRRRAGAAGTPYPRPPRPGPRPATHGPRSGRPP